VQKSQTGNFSFWLGKHHVVALSGEAARKMFLDNHNLDFKSGADLVAMGPDRLPLHDVHASDFHNGRSYFQRRLLDLQKSEQLAKRLPRVTKDARAAVEALAKNPSRVTRPFKSCYSMVVAQGCRIVCTDEISDNPKLLHTLMSYLSILLSNPSPHTVAVPWLPSIVSMKRRYGRYGLGSLVSPIITRRMEDGSPRVDDALQTLIDNGDSKDYMINFFISILFIITANAGATTSIVLSNVANNPYWQDKIYNEIKVVTKTHSKNKNASLVEQLDSIPLEAWESSFPSIDLCFKEAIRMWITFPMIRKNLASYPIPIPGTNEVIPPGSFASYHTSEVHFDEKLYPNPKKFDPNRFLDGREEFKKQTYGCE
jgi:cytochrome P450